MTKVSDKVMFCLLYTSVQYVYKMMYVINMVDICMIMEIEIKMSEWTFLNILIYGNDMARL